MSKWEVVCANGFSFRGAGAEVKIENGAIVCYDVNGSIVFSIAPSYWKSITRVSGD